MIVIESKAGELRKAFVETEDAYLGYGAFASGSTAQVYAYSKDQWVEVNASEVNVL